MEVNEKRIKEELKKKAQKNVEAYYPVGFLKDKGYMRKKCIKCGNYFWSLDPDREVCGDPACIGGYEFIGKENTKTKMDFITSWKIFSKIFSQLGYTPINRYPVVARWRDDMEFVIASIADFQPYVVKGIVDPPANPLVVPQFCLRFTDIDNVGYTGRHYTGFVMIGQHTFVPKEKYDKEKYLSDIHYWLTKGMGIKEEEIIYHEDVWAGGGNIGVSMEFFSKGLEIGNQVYMQYEITESGKIKDLDIAVLDMGMGQERVAWFSQGTHTSYEANFPTVMEYLYRQTSIKIDKEIWQRFLPLSALLNIDEVPDINKVWENIASKLKVDIDVLKEKIEPVAGLFAIAEHSRSLLVALSDGAIPSNVGGGYNLRVIARRMFDIINKFSLDIDIHKVIEEHAKYLKPQYPELSENLESVKKIIEVEHRKYLRSKEVAKNILKGYKNKKISVDEMVKLYDTYGITPDMIKQEGVAESIPENFYSLVSKRHQRTKGVAKAQTKKDVRISLKGIPETTILYWGDWKLTSFEGKILKVKDNYVVLDRTAFYPTSGGQLHDTGYLITGEKRYFVKEVIKKDNHIIHVVEHKGELKEGMRVKGEIDFERRKQHAQHHTATHILNDACRKVLGNHVWQKGAEKTTEKSRLDITHYELPSFEEIQKIEKIANETIQNNLPIEKQVMERDVAERKYGFRIYQGGAPPGKYIRIVKVGDDVEACGGTHLNSSLEVGALKIISVNKIQDGVIRFEFVAGKRAIEYIQEMEKILYKTSSIFSVSYSQIPQTARRFFEEWKQQRKEIQKLKKMEEQILKDEIRRNTKSLEGYKIAEIGLEEYEVKDIIKVLNVLDIDGVLLQQKDKRILIAKNGNAKDIAKKVYNIEENKIKGSDKVAVFY